MPEGFQAACCFTYFLEVVLKCGCIHQSATVLSQKKWLEGVCAHLYIWHPESIQVLIKDIPFQLFPPLKEQWREGGREEQHLGLKTLELMTPGVYVSFFPNCCGLILWI